MARKGLGEHSARSVVPKAWILPCLALYSIALLLPSVQVVWIGVRAAVEGLAVAPAMWVALAHSFELGAATAIFSTLAGMSLALLAYFRVATIALVQGTMVVILALPPSTYSAFWRASMDPYAGWLTAALGPLCHEACLISDSRAALLVVAVVTAAQVSPLTYVLARAALDQIPDEEVEAARLDGCGRVQLASRLLVPRIKPALAFGILVSFLYGFLDFDHVQVLTAGGPGSATDVVSTYIYRVGVRGGGLAEASLMSLVALVVCLPLSAGVPALRGAQWTEMGWGRRISPVDGAGAVVAAVLSVGYCVAISAPLLFGAVNSLRPSSEIQNAPIGLPDVLHLQNYADAWAGPPLGLPFHSYLLNSALVTCVFVCVGVALVPLALAALTWSRARRTTPLILAGLGVPGALLWIPLFQVVSNAGLLGLPPVLGILQVGLQLPLMVALLYPAFAGFPRELNEAGEIDGLRPWQLLFFGALPLLRGPIMMALMVAGLLVWNDLGMALVLLPGSSSQTLPVAISQFRGQYSLEAGPRYAALVLSCIPACALGLALSASNRGRGH